MELIALILAFIILRVKTCIVGHHLTKREYEFTGFDRELLPDFIPQWKRTCTKCGYWEAMKDMESVEFWK